MSILRRKKIIFILASLLIFIGFGILSLRPVVFINPDEAEEVWVSIVFSPGTLLETAESKGAEISNSLSGLPSVKTVYGRAGAEEEDAGRRADIDYKKEELILRCVLKNKANPEKTLVEINGLMKQSGDIPYSVYFPKDRSEVLLGISQERTFVIKGKDREELLERIEIAEKTFKAASIPVNFKPSGQRQELRLFPNREASAFVSMTAASIAETLFIINEGIIAATLEIEGRPLDVRVMANVNSNNVTFNGVTSNGEDSALWLENIPLKTPEGKTVFLGSLGRIERRDAEAALARLDRSDAVYMHTSGKKLPTLKETAARFPWLTRADESVFGRYRNSLLLYIFLGLILLYMTMGAQFESFLLPLILMLSIPFSLAGAGPMLLITGSKIDSGAVLGLTTLFGLVVNNGLVLFEICDEKVRAGYSTVAAVCRGAGERLQPIIITMFTTIFALLPLVFSPMGNSQKSMAAAMLGGLTASTLISLVAIPPVLIWFFNRNKNDSERRS
jgi:multidrug efflux pump subunit AcrB